MLYDSLLLTALVFAVLAPFVVALDGVGPWTSRALIVTTWAGFYAISWSRGGQTLGMTAWRIHLLDTDGQPPSWRQIAVRLLTAPLSFASLGMGYLWFYVDDNRQTWHDRLSGTMVVHLPKQP